MRQWMCIAAAAFLAACATRAAPAPDPVIEVEDVALFYRVYDAAGGRPSAEALERNYLAAGSEGLRVFANARRTTGERIAQAIAENPAMYDNARACADTMPRVRARLQRAMRRLAQIYPEARFPAITIAVGRGRPVAIGGPDVGVKIGLEALCAADFMQANLEDRFVHVVAHEFVHVQQAPEREGMNVLEASLIEGIAEFIGEMISGDVSSAHLRARVAGREAEIEAAFATEADSTDLSNWLYNTGRHDNPDLGYWVGYRIARAYYETARDKRQAIREMMQMTDARAFLAASGWRPAS